MQRKMQRIWAVLILLLWLTACASKGFNRGELKAQTGLTPPPSSDQEIQAALDKKAKLPKPFKLAVYFIPPKERMKPQWRWTEEDKQSLDEIVKDLEREGLIADVFPLPSSTVTEADSRSLRLAAAQLQADALLVVGGSGEIDRYINGWGWTYALLVPALFVPGSHADTLFLTNATLWDVRNNYIYLAAESEATTKTTYVAAFGRQDKDLLAEAKTQAMASLKKELKSMIEGKRL